MPGISRRDEGKARDAGQAVVETHRRLSGWLHAGVKLSEVDRFVARTLEDLGGRSCFLGYKIPGLPAFPSHACLSVNNCVVHGTHNYLARPLEAGDVLKIDIGIALHGWIGDAAWTYVFGEMSDDARRITDCGKELIRRGVAALQAGRPLIEWAEAVQDYVEGEQKMHLVRGLGGHGYGRQLHQPPFVSNVRPVVAAEWPEARLKLKPGLLLAVEPMIALGSAHTRQAPGHWPIFIDDDSLSVHYEHDVLVTENGPELMTAGLDELEDVITR